MLPYTSKAVRLATVKFEMDMVASNICMAPALSAIKLIWLEAGWASTLVKLPLKVKVAGSLANNRPPLSNNKDPTEASADKVTS